jgi:hypothetical protein
MSAEQLEELVFAAAAQQRRDAEQAAGSAGSPAAVAGPPAATAAGDQPSKATGAGARGKAGRKGAAAGPSAEVVMRDAALPTELEAWLTSALAAGMLSPDGSALQAQLQELRSVAAASAAGPSGSAEALAGNEWRSAAAAVERLAGALASDAPAATVAVLTHPRLLAISPSASEGRCGPRPREQASRWAA